MALTFITMCRIAGVPARWQSGLYVAPDSVGSHDWAAVSYTHLDVYKRQNPGRVQLSRSIRYLEGLRSRMEFSAFRLSLIHI